MDQSQLIADIYEYFFAHGAWPLVRTLQTRYSSSVNVRLLAAEIGRDIISCDSGSDGACRLTLEALATHEPATADLKNLVRALRFTAERYGAQGPIAVTHDDYAAALGLTPPETRRLAALLCSVPIFTTLAWDTSRSEFELTPAESVLFYDSVKTFADVRAAQRRSEADSRLISELLAREYIAARRKPRGGGVQDRESGPPERYRLADPRLDALFTSDLAELDLVHGHEAWKAAALLAGSCLETLLFDLCRSDERARERLGRRSPRKATGRELLVMAEELELIDPNHRGMADAIRRWRNLIHPEAALELHTPSREIADALVAALKLIMKDLGARRASK